MIETTISDRTGKETDTCRFCYIIIVCGVEKNDELILKSNMLHLKFIKTICHIRSHPDKRKVSFRKRAESTWEINDGRFCTDRHNSIVT